MHYQERHRSVVCQLSTEIEKPIIPVETKQSIGIDVGLSSLLTVSNASQIEPPEFLRSSEKKMVKEQIRLSRKKKGSNNRKKQINILKRSKNTVGTTEIKACLSSLSTDTMTQEAPAR
jgi:transposase